MISAEYAQLGGSLGLSRHSALSHSALNIALDQEGNNRPDVEGLLCSVADQPGLMVGLGEPRGKGGLGQLCV